MITQLHDEPSSPGEAVASDDAPKIRGERQACRRQPAVSSFGLRRLSVIIPTLNEEQTIEHTLDRIRCGSAWEVIVVDGGSSDRTVAIARARGATVVESTAGRGRQLTVGASIATGDTLLFLHADTSLPLRFDEYIHSALDQPDVCAGAFRLRIDGEGRSFRLIEKMVSFRSRVRQMPYGDQAIFVRANVFHEIGGFPDVPIMEDYVLIRRLRRIGRIEIAPASVVTSARRWHKHGVWRTTLLNQICVAAYRLGVSAAEIARWRERLYERAYSVLDKPDGRTSSKVELHAPDHSCAYDIEDVASYKP